MLDLDCWFNGGVKTMREGEAKKNARRCARLWPQSPQFLTSTSLPYRNLHAFSVLFLMCWTRQCPVQGRRRYLTDSDGTCSILFIIGNLRLVRFILLVKGMCWWHWPKTPYEHISPPSSEPPARCPYFGVPKQFNSRRRSSTTNLPKQRGQDSQFTVLDRNQRVHPST